MNNTNNKTKLISVIVIIVISFAIFFILYFSLNRKNEESKYVTLTTQQEDLRVYNIDLFGAIKDRGLLDKIKSIGEYNIKLDFKLKNYNVQLQLNDGVYDNLVRFDLYINDKFIISDALEYNDTNQNNISINFLGDYLLYVNHFETDMKSKSVTVVDKNLNINVLYDLETVSGMKTRTIEITDKGIILEADRISHGPSVEYGQQYMILTKDDCQVARNQLPKDLIVRATYTYEYKNGNLNLNPIINNQVTFENYVNQDDNACGSNNDLEKEEEPEIKEIDSSKYVTLTRQKNDRSSYNINLYQAVKDMNLLEKLETIEQYNIKIDFKLKNYNVQLQLKNGYLGTTTTDFDYDLYINNKFIMSDSLLYSDSYKNNISINILGEYVLYVNHRVTDIKARSVTVVDKNLNINVLYDLEDISGMIPRSLSITDEGIVFEADRLSHGLSIVYGNMYMINTKEECEEAQKHLPKDLIMEATYTYEYKNGVLNLNPVISNQVTFENYITQNDSICRSN